MAEESKNDMQKEKMRPHDEDWFSGGRGSLWPGLVLILMGAFFLARNYFGFELENWWALFILIPAFSNLSRAWERYQASGSFDRGVRSHILWGIILAAVSFTFLLGLDFGLIWPAFLILLGLGFLFGAM